jgi:DNA mismatch repair ATPase MutS
MEIDKTTINDLSIFDRDDNASIFQKLDYTKTVGGREKLRQAFMATLPSIKDITAVQQTVSLIAKNKEIWPATITNGSLMVIQKFYESNIDQIPHRPSITSAYYYKIFHGPDFSLVKYSTGYCFDFIKQMHLLATSLLSQNPPAVLKVQLEKILLLVSRDDFKVIKHNKQAAELSKPEMLGLAYFFRYHFKTKIDELLAIYQQLDAWYGMAMATLELNLQFPTFIESKEPHIEADGLYHILLPKPVPYDVQLDKDNNFIFLTGANMAGKSTFIKSVGIAAFLAHIGMGVPAKRLELTLFDGLLSNINVVDNIAKGESFFYNEVQRIKNTIIKINDSRKWLVLIDELFKGTNVQDAMKCSSAVIEGLIRITNSLFILSTHLYEIGDGLKHYPNIAFKYFETAINDEQLTFNYRLQDGISNDRIGYLILKREKVIELLEKL